MTNAGEEMNIARGLTGGFEGENRIFKILLQHAITGRASLGERRRERGGSELGKEGRE